MALGDPGWPLRQRAAHFWDRLGPQVVVNALLFAGLAAGGVWWAYPLLWLLPVISAGIALTSAEAVIYLLAKSGQIVVNAQSAGILTILVFGVGTDYALLLVARYREELRRHEDKHEALALALSRAGPAIVAAIRAATGRPITRVPVRPHDIVPT